MSDESQQQHRDPRVVTSPVPDRPDLVEVTFDGHAIIMSRDFAREGAEDLFSVCKGVRE
jgi:hypothetical protein